MKRIFITGSTTGLGLLAGQILLKQGHEVVFHARSEKSEKKEKAQYVIGDLSTLEGMKSVAEQVNALGKFDAVIHNAGVYQSSPHEIFHVNVLAPYVLTTLIHRPERLVYLSSGLHLDGKADLTFKEPACNYNDSKLFVLMMTKYFARKWPECFVNSVNPGWVPTRMGGAGAPDDLMKGADTQAWLSVSDDKAALVSGKYFFHKKEQPYNPLADSEEAQDKLIAQLQSFSRTP